MTRCLFILLLLAATVHAADPMAGYLMGYFAESPKGKGNSHALHLAISEDGLDWMPLNQNQPVLVSRLGKKGLRDPFFLRKQDGGFVVLAANQAGGNPVATPDIFVCHTADFITFEHARLVTLHDTPMQTLAPEVFFDPDRNQYGILWTGDTDHHRIHLNYTRDFIHVRGREVFFDPGNDVLDATLCTAPDQGGHFLYFTESDSSRPRGTRSDSLDPRSFDQNSYTMPIGRDVAVSPVVVKALHENRWFLHAGSSVWQTDDITRDTWREINKRDHNPPLNSMHPTVIPITREELDRLIGHWGRPKWNRLKSWSSPDHFVRHENLLGRISPYPFDPYQDSQWIPVPGLADAKGVSFESANFPGSYLRTVAGHVVLAKDDGSPVFRTKATFVKVPGLADSSWSSFRALSQPDLYLRHANKFLRLEPVISPADKEDATFRVVY